MLNGPQVFGVHHIGAVLVFFYGHEFAGLLGFFKQEHLACCIFCAGFNFVIPAAGIGTSTLIGIAVTHVAREQAATRVSNAQSAMHKHFKLCIWAVLPNLFHLV